MRAYVCVYLHPTPGPRDRAQTEEAATKKSLLRRYLNSYDKTDSILDWGDDPSFFSAQELLGDIRGATWGVCRRDVRQTVESGDFVVFICAREQAPRTWDYYFIGVATMGEPLTREEIWSDGSYAVYRDFLNVLARPGVKGRLKQHEWVHAFHEDWLKRCAAPYWLFDPDKSALNLSASLHIASYHGPTPSIERWRTRDPRVRKLRGLLLRGAKDTRGLRSLSPYRPHPKLNLRNGYSTDSSLSLLRTKLLSYVDA